jgi:hypothetical protein
MTQGWGGADVRVAYDETAKAVGVKGLVEVAVAATGGSLRVGMFYNNKVGNRYGVGLPGGAAGETANWSAGLGYTQDVTETLNATSVTSTLTASRLPRVVPPRPLTWLKALCPGLRSPTSTFVLKVTTAGTSRMLT